MDLSIPATALSLGIALGLAPGPVQLLLLSEASRGGIGRGLRAMAGANGTFGLLLVALAAGLSFLSPTGPFLRGVKVAGGLLLVWIAVDTAREARNPAGATSQPWRGLHPASRGVLAVLLNPGAWVFLATTASALLGDATDDGGRPLAFLTAAALLLGVSLTDGAVVLVGAGGRRRLPDRARALTGHALAAGLAALGGLFLYQGIRP